MCSVWPLFGSSHHHGPHKNEHILSIKVNRQKHSFSKHTHTHPQERQIRDEWNWTAFFSCFYFGLRWSNECCEVRQRQWNRFIHLSFRFDTLRHRFVHIRTFGYTNQQGVSSAFDGLLFIQHASHCVWPSSSPSSFSFYTLQTDQHKTLQMHIKFFMINQMVKNSPIAQVVEFFNQWKYYLLCLLVCLSCAMIRLIVQQ